MKNALIHYGGYLLSAIGAVFGVSLLSHFVIPEHYGRLALYIAIATLFQYVVRESLGAGLLRYSENIIANKRNVSKLIKESLWLLIVIYSVVVTISYIYFSHAYILEFSLAMLLVVLLGFSAAGESYLSALHNRNACAVHVNMVQWLRFIFAAIFYVYFEQSVLAILLGFCLGFLIAVLYDIFIYAKQSNVVSNTVLDEVSVNIFAGKTAVAIGVLSWFLAFYERIALEFFHGEAYLGVYFVLYQIGFVPVVMLMRSTSTFLFPRLFINGEIDSQHLNRKTLMIIIVFILSCFASLQLLHGWLFSWLVGASYQHYSWLLPWIFLAAMLNACAYILQVYFYDGQSLATLLWIKWVVSLAFFVVATYFIWQFAMPGLIASLVITSLMLLLMSYYAVKK